MTQRNDKLARIALLAALLKLQPWVDCSRLARRAVRWVGTKITLTYRNR